MSEPKASKSFKDWTQDDLEYALDVTRTLKITPEMQDWIHRASTIEIQKDEKKILQALRDLADEEIDGWNETELREYFLMDIIKLVDFRMVEYNVNRFSERYISVVVKEIKMHGYIDFMVAKGRKRHHQPFFFIHEFKHEQGGNNDVRGQLVSAMVAAQQLNKIPPLADLFNPVPSHYYAESPIYGLYLLGRFWFFAVLKDKKYFIHKAYDISDLDELYYIFKMLKAQKQIILEQVKQYELTT